MNIFYSKAHGTAAIIKLANAQTSVVRKVEKGDIFYYDMNGSLVGFNIFLKQAINDLEPGRLILNEELKAILSSLYPTLRLVWEPEFIVGEIKQCHPIPDTHLTTCLVDIKTTHLQIVCGAANVKVGLKTVVAMVGTIFTNGLFIQHAKLKGFDSYGMLCSQKELSLVGYNQTGIIDLKDDLPNGSVFVSLYS